MTDPNQFPAQQYDDIKDILPDHSDVFNGVDGGRNEFFDPAGNSIPQHQMDTIQDYQHLIRNENFSEPVPFAITAPPQDLGHRPYAWKDPVAAPIREHLSATNKEVARINKEAFKMLGEFAVFHVESAMYVASGTAKAVRGAARLPKKLKRSKNVEAAVLPEEGQEDTEKIDLLSPADAPTVEEPVLPVPTPPTSPAPPPTPIRPGISTQPPQPPRPAQVAPTPLPPPRPRDPIEAAWLGPEQNGKMMRRVQYLQKAVDNVFRDMQKHPNGQIGLQKTIDSFAQEFTDIISSEEFANIGPDQFRISEGGLQLLQRGLLAGEVPTFDDFDNLHAFFEGQDIERAVVDSSGNPAPYLQQEPRYYRAGQPAFGPYESDECDTVAHVEALIHPDTWALSDEDRAYLQTVLNTTDIVKYKTAPGPSGDKHFWNKPPFNTYINQGLKDKMRNLKGELSQEQQRVADMSDPNKLRQIRHSNTMLEWWEQSVNKIYLTNSATHKANKDAIIIADLQAYARARLELDEDLELENQTTPY